MSTAVAPPRDVIKHVAPDGLEARKRIIISELERRFGSLDAALAQEVHGEPPVGESASFRRLPRRDAPARRMIESIDEQTRRFASGLTRAVRMITSDAPEFQVSIAGHDS